MVQEAILGYYRKNKIRFILFLALIIRLGSAVFSTGYGFHDDHFITVEVAQSWIDGVNINDWMPDREKGIVTPSGHSLTYPSLLCSLLYVAEKTGIDDPADKMLFIRILHALFSLLIVWWGYRIVQKLYDEHTALRVAWALALFWMFPMLGVRNLVEFVCIPPLMGGVWLLVKHDARKWLPLLLAGLVTGIAFSIRFQCGFFLIGLGLAVWFKRGFVPAVWFSLGVLVSVLLLQGVIDTAIWGYPFAELKGYIDYNLQYSGLYPNGPWYNYTLLVIGVLIPPVSLMLIFGYFREWKHSLLIVLPVLFFFVFHSWFPNKQERFILPVLPFLIMVGIAGWQRFETRSAFWQRFPRLLRGCWIFAISLNTLLLLLLSFSSSKKNRVDAMHYLSRYRNITCLAIENSNHVNGVIMPKFYLRHQWPRQVNICSDMNFEALKTELKDPAYCTPPFIVFMEAENIEQRVAKMKTIFPNLTYEATIEPSFVDQVMHKLNPRNVNQVTYIYRTR